MLKNPILLVDFQFAVQQNLDDFGGTLAVEDGLPSAAHHRPAHLFQDSAAQVVGQQDVPQQQDRVELQNAGEHSHYPVYHIDFWLDLMALKQLGQFRRKAMDSLHDVGADCFDGLLFEGVEVVEGSSTEEGGETDEGVDLIAHLQLQEGSDLGQTLDIVNILSDYGESPQDASQRFVPFGIGVELFEFG